MNDHPQTDGTITAPPKPQIADQPLFARDTLYAQYFSAAPQFCFDANVAAVFPDMIRRSVPGYGTVLELIPGIAASCLAPGDSVYDLGCSVGAGLLAVRQALRRIKSKAATGAHPENTAQRCQHASSPDNDHRPLKLIGIDTSAEMLKRAQTLFDTLPNSSAQSGTHEPDTAPAQAALPYTVDFREADITDIELQPAKLILLNYTLQFLPITERDKLIQKIHAALLPGGALLLSEKVIHPSHSQEVALTKLHESFKLSQGYSALEVARKRQAIEDVLIREQASTHIARMSQAGFTQITPVMQCLQFTSFLAVKA